jgi:hypothetical protein
MGLGLLKLCVVYRLVKDAGAIFLLDLRSDLQDEALHAERSAQSAKLAGIFSSCYEIINL